MGLLRSGIASPAKVGATDARPSSGATSSLLVTPDRDRAPLAAELAVPDLNSPIRTTEVGNGVLEGDTGAPFAMSTVLVVLQ